VPGQEKRQRSRERICPIAGPGKLSASERERKAKEIIAASGVNTEEYFNKVVLQSNHGVTFREQAATWLDKMRNRKRKPVVPTTLVTWSCAVDKWLNPNIGDLPLESVNNAAMKALVAKMDEGALSPKSIRNYTQIVKSVVASAVNDEGEELYPRKWNSEFIDMPEVKEQKQPSFTAEVVTAILARVAEEKYRMLFALCAATGLRFGEALGIDIKSVSPDHSTIAILQKAWGSDVQSFLKTKSGKREVDLHSSIAAMLREYMENRAREEWAGKTDLLFASRTGLPLHQSSVVRRKLHPILAALGQPKCGLHAFRRFRHTYLRNYTSTPPGLIKFWMGHAGEGMSDLYDKIKHDVAFRKEVAERMGIGFEIPSKSVQVWQENCRFGLNGPKRTEKPDVHLSASV